MVEDDFIESLPPPSLLDLHGERDANQQGIVLEGGAVALTDSDIASFGPSAPAAIEQLVAAGLLRRRPTGWFWTRRERASTLADLRGTGGIDLAELAAGAQGNAHCPKPLRADGFDIEERALWEGKVRLAIG